MGDVVGRGRWAAAAWVAGAGQRQDGYVDVGRQLGWGDGLVCWVAWVDRRWRAPVWLAGLGRLLERCPRGGVRGCVGVVVRPIFTFDGWGVG